MPRTQVDLDAVVARERLHLPRHRADHAAQERVRLRAVLAPAHRSRRRMLVHARLAQLVRGHAGRRACARAPGCLTQGEALWVHCARARRALAPPLHARRGARVPRTVHGRSQTTRSSRSRPLWQHGARARLHHCKLAEACVSHTQRASDSARPLAGSARRAAAEPAQGAGAWQRRCSASRLRAGMCLPPCSRLLQLVCERLKRLKRRWAALAGRRAHRRLWTAG